MKTRMLWLLCCVVALSSQAQTTSRTLWVWKDANGVTHYSDKPEAGAKRMVLAGTTPAAPQSTETSPRSASEGEGHSRGDGAAGNPPAQIVRYESLAIDTPTEEQTFFGADGVVPIQVSSNPELADGDTLVIYLDGKPADAPENSYQVTLSGVERGEHVLTASILDSQARRRSTARRAASSCGWTRSAIRAMSVRPCKPKTHAASRADAVATAAESRQVASSSLRRRLAEARRGGSTRAPSFDPPPPSW